MLVQSVISISQLHPFLMQFITDYSTLQSWLPIVSLALIASVSLVALYYMVGVAVNSRKIKETAVYEFGQAFGTAILVVLIIAAMALFSTVFSGIISPATTQGICKTLGGSPIYLVNAVYTNNNQVGSTGTIASAASPTEVICKNIIGSSAGVGGDMTSGLDYGLGSVYVIAANTTNQTVANLNSLYIFTTWIAFLSKFNTGSEICFPDTCIAGEGPGVRIEYTYVPLAGYTFLNGVILPLQTQALFMFEMNVMELVIIILMLYLWPYLLAAGLILRATIYGRRVGGLLFAIAVTAVIVYPIVFLTEYTALTSNSLTPIGIPANAVPATFNNIGQTTFYGTGTTSNSFANLNIYELPTNDFYSDPANEVVYKFNAFVFPRLDEVANADGCWPGLASLGLFAAQYGSPLFATQAREAAQGNLLIAETTYAEFYLVPLVGLGVGLGNLVGTGLGFVDSVPYVPTTCTPAQALQTFFDFINVYAIMAVEGIILPILNLLIAIVAIRGISGMLGGDTNIIGLGKLV